MRQQIRNRASIIKVCVSGGVMSLHDDPEHRQFSSAELRAFVEEAALADRAVMAHAHGKAGIMAAVEAGVHTIEHGTFVDEDAALAMRERDVMLVPTRTAIDLVNNNPGLMTPESAAKAARVVDSHAQGVAAAHAAGVAIAAGSDLAGSGRHHPWGLASMRQEASKLRGLGLSASDAVASATAQGPLTLGPQAPRTGQLVTGYDGDVLAVDFNPLDETEKLGVPDHVVAVYEQGRLEHHRRPEPVP